MNDNKPKLKVDVDGSKYWFLNGKCHREDGLPAIEYADGSKYWYLNGKYHREDGGPAIEYADGSKEWYVNGKQLTEEEVKTWQFKQWALKGKEINHSL